MIITIIGKYRLYYRKTEGETNTKQFGLGFGYRKVTPKKWYTCLKVCKSKRGDSGYRWKNKKCIVIYQLRFLLPKQRAANKIKFA